MNITTFNYYIGELRRLRADLIFNEADEDSPLSETVEAHIIQATAFMELAVQSLKLAKKENEK